MRDVLGALRRHWESGNSVGVGTVVATFSSAPRAPGAAMLVDGSGEVAGSVSGGCVEGAVYETAGSVLAGDPPTLSRYGVSDDDAFAVGLTCGGIIDVFVERVDRETFPRFDVLADSVAAGEPVAVATVIEAPDESRVGGRVLVWHERSEGELGSDRLDDAVVDDARGMLATGRTGVLEYGPDGQRRGEGLRVFVNSFEPPPRMLVFGAIDFAAAMTRVGAFLGYRVTVCDARPVFATSSRFPDAHEVVVDWPHRYLETEARAGRLDSRTAVLVLTHDPKFDVPVLRVALRQPLAYVGAMGSRRTHRDRLERLRTEGVTDSELAALSSPLGLDLGARTPEETAVSISAELIASRWGGTGQRLSRLEGAIHHEPELPELSERSRAAEQ
ncbi:xanthine dehydrogenase accessory factor [Actinopolyspora mzabensis]|uniref:Xanthine dehydrogenase accessory factor n=1 Tax=Actinopolyspora mzabensis TaxID=995066 RepID=A0A1G9C586_ACTMZ|nr:XdhC/CoxI family protein [Actinopolyspora mzabensis]SDK46839.1 xanthine dehydrogenase accessory factor [Actinopolyspora mzabensis]